MKFKKLSVLSLVVCSALSISAVQAVDELALVPYESQALVPARISVPTIVTVEELKDFASHVPSIVDGPQIEELDEEPVLQASKSSFQMIQDGTLEIFDGAKNLSYGVGNTVYNTYKGVKGGIELVVGAVELSYGVMTNVYHGAKLALGFEEQKDADEASRNGKAWASSGYENLTQGVADLKDSFSNIPHACKQLYNGVVSLGQGGKELFTGIKSIVSSVNSYLSPFFGK